MPEIKTEDLWKKWIGALQAVVFPGGMNTGQQFSAGSTTLNVDLADKDPEITNYNIYSIGHVVPAAGPSYAPGSDLLSSYAVFLDCIDLCGSDNPNLQSQINIATEKLNTAQETYSNVQAKAYSQYADYKKIEESAVPFNDWAVTHYPLYIEAFNNLKGEAADYDKLLSKQHGPGFTVLQAAKAKVSPLTGALNLSDSNSYNMAVKMGTIAPPGSQDVTLGGQNPPQKDNLKSAFVPSFVLEGFREKYAEWQSASVKGKTNAGGSISISSSTDTYDYTKLGWDASIKGNWVEDFVRIFAKGSTKADYTNVNTTSKEFNLTVDFTGLGTFKISPGLWWDQGVIETYKNQLLPKSPDFFGDSGSMASLPYQVVVGFEPTVKLKMTADDYSRVKASWKAAATASVGIGPFVIGKAAVSTYGEKEDMKFEDDSSTVTIGPISSTLPVLLGVVSQKL